MFGLFCIFYDIINVVVQLITAIPICGNERLAVANESPYPYRCCRVSFYGDFDVETEEVQFGDIR